MKFNMKSVLCEDSHLGTYFFPSNLHMHPFHHVFSSLIAQDDIPQVDQDASIIRHHTKTIFHEKRLLMHT